MIAKTAGGRILVADDETELSSLLCRLLADHGFEAFPAPDGDAALSLLESRRPDLVIADYRMPGRDGLEVLREARKRDPDLPVVLITAYADVRGAVEAMKAGATDYLAKPFDHHDVVEVVRRAMGERRVRSAPPSESSGAWLRESMGPSAAVGRIISEVDRVAPSGFSVVILGETGSGKELVAQAIHRSSARSDGPFVPLDCGAIPESLIESELFGHEKGAFTGAQAQRRGKFEAAQGGTLFLDEISNMPLPSQAKLLRVLQERMLCRVGGTEPVAVDVRVLVASNQDLRVLAAGGAFRRDLFFRLGEFTVQIPPLRARRDDVEYLARRFLKLTNEELGKGVRGFHAEAMRAVVDFEWPGNARQLRSTIRRAVLLADGEIRPEHLDIRGAPPPEPVPAGEELPLKESVRRAQAAVEREALLRTLKKTGGNKAEAARLLRIDYKTIHTKIRDYGIEV